jgi:hypothetical protein
MYLCAILATIVLTVNFTLTPATASSVIDLVIDRLITTRSATEVDLILPDNLKMLIPRLDDLLLLATLQMVTMILIDS